MKLSAIAGLMRGTASPASFRETHAAILAERRRALQERGSAVSVRVDEDIDLSVSRGDMAALCALFVSGLICEIELAYVADVLQLSDRVTFVDDHIADYLAELTDPEVNGQFTPRRAQEIIDEIRQHT